MSNPAKILYIEDNESYIKQAREVLADHDVEGVRTLPDGMTRLTDDY